MYIAQANRRRALLVPLHVTEGLVLRLDASNTNSYPGTGTTWFDLSGNDYDATMYGTTSYDSGTNSINLGSSPHATNYVSIPLTPLNTLSTWTIEIAMQRDASNSIDSFFSGGPGNDMLCLFNGANLSIYNIATTDLAYSVTNGVPFLLTLTGTSNIIKIYKDGVYLGQMSNTTLLSPTSTIGWVLGQEFDAVDGGFASTQSFLGRYFAVRFYNKQLSQAEITKNFEIDEIKFNL